MLLDQGTYSQIHPAIRGLFSGKMPHANMEGRLAYFVKNWQLLTQDQSVLSIVRGYKLQFLREPCQHKLPHVAKMSVPQAQLVQQEIIDMLKKGAIHKVSHVQGEFLSNLFLVDKKGGAHRPVINLKHLNAFIPYQHFKMEGLHLLKDLLQEGDYMCKLDLKDAYFSVPIHKSSRKYLRFLWEGNLYEFLCLCFGLGRSIDFHKNNENTHCFASPIKHSNYNLSRRHVNSGSVYSGINLASRHSYLPLVTIRLYNQLQKVNFVSSSENRISGINNRFLKNGIDIRSRKNIQDNLSMSGYVQFSEHDSDEPKHI